MITKTEFNALLQEFMTQQDTTPHDRHRRAEIARRLLPTAEAILEATHGSGQGQTLLAGLSELVPLLATAMHEWGEIQAGHDLPSASPAAKAEHAENEWCCDPWCSDKGGTVRNGGADTILLMVWTAPTKRHQSARTWSSQ
ncbi:MAG: hypothetical protein H7840_04145 [Alphaproteobacteria bacterium]